MYCRFALLLAGLALYAPAHVALAQGPATSDPDGRLIAGYDAPGDYPTTVTATNINVTPLEGAVFDSTFEDFLQVEFVSSGPAAWTSSRFNNGDIAVSFGLAEPENPLSYPESDFVENFQAMNVDTAAAIDPNSTDLTALAWRASYFTGGLFATTRHNGKDDGYVVSAGGADVGEIQGVSYFIADFSQGWGFRMSDGQFGNGGGGSSDLVVGKVGTGGEASFDTSAAYFPYEEGWLGAWVNEGENGAAGFDSRPDSVPSSSVTWTNGQADVSLPEVDSATDGMLFVAPSNGSSSTRLASAFPNDNGGWTTTVRSDDNDDTTGATFRTSGNDFQFMYMPYDTQNLIGGHVDGDDASLINSAGDDFFTLARTADGAYSLSVFEDDMSTKKTEDDGMLMFSVADTVDGSTTLGSRAFMTYEYDSASGDFLIEAKELVDLDSSAADADGFGNEFDLVDVNFYFAWVDFQDPLAVPTSITGDFNEDGMVDAADYTVWRDGYTSGEYDVEDYLDWQANFGAGAGAEAVTTTPEPTAAALLSLASVAAGYFRRR